MIVLSRRGVYGIVGMNFSVFGGCLWAPHARQSEVDAGWWRESAGPRHTYKTVCVLLLCPPVVAHCRLIAVLCVRAIEPSPTPRRFAKFYCLCEVTKFYCCARQMLPIVD